MRRDIAEEEVKRMVESVRQLKVHSIHFDQAPTEKVMGRRTALVRLEPLPLPWQTTEEEVLPAFHLQSLEFSSSSHVMARRNWRNTRMACFIRIK